MKENSNSIEDIFLAVIIIILLRILGILSDTAFNIIVRMLKGEISPIGAILMVALLAALFMYLHEIIASLFSKITSHRKR